MAQNWRYSSRKARRELGYRARALDRTLADTIDWYRELIETRRARRAAARSPLSLAAAGDARWPTAPARSARCALAERYVGRRLVAAVT